MASTARGCFAGLFLRHRGRGGRGVGRGGGVRRARLARGLVGTVSTRARGMAGEGRGVGSFETRQGIWGLFGVRVNGMDGHALFCMIAGTLLSGAVQKVQDCGV